MPEELHLEEAARVWARHPRWLAAPGAGGGEGLELGVHTFQTLLWQPVQAVVEDSPHAI
jgi:predicted dehydrogenase